MKYLIACCDDDSEALEQLKEFFAELNLSMRSEDVYEVDYCLMGRELLKRYESDSTPYDMLILDLELGDCHGLELAREIRRYDREVLVMFLTGYPQYMKESFQVRPFSFMEKNVTYREFSQEIKRATRHMEEDKNHFWLICEKEEEHVLRLNEIMYVDKIKDTNMIRIVTDRGVFEVRKNLSHIRDILLRNCFISTSRSCLVNLKFFYKLEGNVVELRNGMQLVASKRRVETIKKQILEYVEVLV